MTDTDKQEIIGVLTASETNTFNNLRARELALEATFEAAWLNHMNIVEAIEKESAKIWDEICERLGIDRDGLSDDGYRLRVEMRHATASVVKLRTDRARRP